MHSADQQFIFILTDERSSEILSSQWLVGNGACFVNSIVFGTCSEKDKFVSCFCFSLQGNFHTCNSSTPSPSLCCCWKTGKEEEREGRREGGREGGRGRGKGSRSGVHDSVLLCLVTCCLLCIQIKLLQSLFCELVKLNLCVYLTILLMHFNYVYA